MLYLTFQIAPLGCYHLVISIAEVCLFLVEQFVYGTESRLFVVVVFLCIYCCYSLCFHSYKFHEYGS